MTGFPRATRSGPASSRPASSRPASSRLARPVLAGLLLALLAVLFGPASPASAHAYLIDSDPASGTVVASVPEQVVLTFSEPVRLVPDRILVVGPDGERVDPGEPRVDGADVIVPLDEGAGTRGTYLVSYRVISADSHPVAGSITFSVGAPSAAPALPAEADLVDPGMRTAMSVTRYVSYAGLVLVVGPALMLGWLWPQRLPRRSAARLAWLGLGLVGAGTVAGLVLQAPYSTGGSLAEVTASEVREVLGTTYGQVALVRLGVLMAVAVMLGPLLAGRAGRTDLMLLGALAIVGLSTWPVSGHPIASPLPAVSIAVTTVHLAAAALWVGGLVVLAGFLLRLANQRELGAILPVWSGWAAAAVAALLITGLIQAVVEVGVPSAVLTTSYGRFLLVKVALVIVVIAVAGFSRRLVRQRSALRPRAMRVAVALEAVLLAGVVALSAVLVQTTPARTEAAAAAAGAVAADFHATVEHEHFFLEVTVEPARVGANTLHAYAFAPTGEPLVVREWGASAILPAADLERLPIELTRISDNHALGEVMLPLEGEWEVRITVRVSEVDQQSVVTTVPIG
jgi:copper transport protein